MDLVLVQIVEAQLRLRPGLFCGEPRKPERGVTTYLGNREARKVFEQGRKMNQSMQGGMEERETGILVLVGKTHWGRRGAGAKPCGRMLAPHDRPWGGIWRGP